MAISLDPPAPRLRHVAPDGGHPPVWQLEQAGGVRHRLPARDKPWRPARVQPMVGDAPLPDRVDPRSAAGLILPRRATSTTPRCSIRGPGSSGTSTSPIRCSSSPTVGSLFARTDAGLSTGRRPEEASPRPGDPRSPRAGRSTPVLVMGVERRCRVATDPNPAAGRPDGLYGNAFARAGADAVRRATTRIDPPTVTNLVAIAARRGLRALPGRRDRVGLVTAYTGFRAAVLGSWRRQDAAWPVAVHTGYWGCGAFGGNRVLMTLLQGDGRRHGRARSTGLPHRRGRRPRVARRCAGTCPWRAGRRQDGLDQRSYRADRGHGVRVGHERRQLTNHVPPGHAPFPRGRP